MHLGTHSSCFFCDQAKKKKKKVLKKFLKNGKNREKQPRCFKDYFYPADFLMENDRWGVCLTQDP